MLHEHPTWPAREGSRECGLCPADSVPLSVRGLHLDPRGILCAKEWTERTRCGSDLPTPVGQAYSYLPS
eukprot:4886211-Prymnesium_polylepis.1